MTQERLELIFKSLDEESEGETVEGPSTQGALNRQSVALVTNRMLYQLS